MSISQLQYLLRQLKKEPCTRASDIYKAVLENVLAGRNPQLYADELNELQARFPQA